MWNSICDFLWMKNWWVVLHFSRWNRNCFPSGFQWCILVRWFDWMMMKWIESIICVWCYYVGQWIYVCADAVEMNLLHSLRGVLVLNYLPFIMSFYMIIGIMSVMEYRWMNGCCVDGFMMYFTPIFSM